MNIRENIEDFLEFVLGKEHEERFEDLSELILKLDKLAVSISDVSYTFDETEYPDSPDFDYQKVRKAVEKRFSILGYYNTSQDISENLNKSKIVVGDAIDDISDIAGDLQNVLWCFENTSDDNALWHYENSYRYHWGKHLRELQLYLYDKQW